MKHLGDITKINGAEIEVVDVIIGGSPCQNLSQAGNRKGLSGEQSYLYLEQLRVVKEMREHDRRNGRTGFYVRPRYMLWENVPGAFSTNKGEDFGAVLQETIRIIEPEAPPVPVPTKGWPTSGYLYSEMGEWSLAWRVFDSQFWGSPQRRKRIALLIDFGGMSAPEILFEREGMRWNSSTIGETQPPTATTSSRCIEHAVYDARGGGDGSTVCTITGDHENRVTDYTALYCKKELTPFTMQAFGEYKEGEPASSLKHRDYKDATDLVVENVIALDRAFYNQGENAQYTPQLYEDGTIPTLVARGPGAVCVKNTVRRLTPLECERLQGFPDGWTDIGAWTDSKGKLHKESSDSARYKALGNSIALPPWKYVLKRISAQYERDATMGSLFDGLGGFPYLWMQYNGKDSVRWASEIEDFCIAVTKYRFGDS